jgi:hypothetical protein
LTEERGAKCIENVLRRSIVRLLLKINLSKQGQFYWFILLDFSNKFGNPGDEWDSMFALKAEEFITFDDNGVQRGLEL